MAQQFEMKCVKRECLPLQVKRLITWTATSLYNYGKDKCLVPCDVDPKLSFSLANFSLAKTASTTIGYTSPIIGS